MSEQDKYDTVSDEMLVAFLDNQLGSDQSRALAERLADDERLAHRLAFLSSASVGLPEAFDSLLCEAPRQRMEERLSRALVVREKLTPQYSRRKLIAAAISLVAMGGGVGAGLQSMLGGDGPENRNWRAVVANYMSLYSTVTLAHLSRDAGMLDRQVGSVSQALGLPLKRADVEMSGLELRRAQILQYRQKPLAQLAYLDTEGNPLAFCVIAVSKGKVEPSIEHRDGLTIVYWSSSAHSFLVIGNRSEAAMLAMASRLRETLPS